MDGAIDVGAKLIDAIEFLMKNFTSTTLISVCENDFGGFVHPNMVLYLSWNLLITR